MEASGESVRHTNGIWTADEDSLPYLSAGEMKRPPIKLILSLVGYCNLRCFHCLGTSEEMVRASQDPTSAQPELIDFLVDHVIPGVRAIRLGGVGYTEQLMSRSFDYFMQRMQPHAPHLGYFELTTNLSVMTEARADLLAQSLTDLQVSIEGVGDNFTKIRGMPWHRLVKNFQVIREAKRRYPKSRMKITLLVCAMSDMLDDLLRFDVFQDLGVENIIIRELYSRAEHHEKHVLHRAPEKTRAFIREFRKRAEERGIEHHFLIAPLATTSIAQQPLAEATAIRRPSSRPELGRCTLPFEVLTVVHTGRFGVCCYITDLAGPPASLSTLNIMDVWNSPRFVALRRAVNSSSPPPTCLTCEVKVGHLSEEEKASMMIQVENDKLGAEVEAPKRLEAALREAVARAEQAETRTAELVHALDERDRTIDAMTRTRVWRMAGRWWALKRAVSEFFRRR